MKIRIGQVIIENADWQVMDGKASIKFETEESYVGIAETFDNENTQIELLDENEQIIGKWYAKGLVSIGIESGIAMIIYNVSIIDSGKEAEFETGIDDANGALIELAEIIAEHDESIEEINEKLDEMGSKIDEKVEQIEETLVERIKDVEDALSERVTIETQIDQRLNNLADRIALLENKIGG